MLNTAIVLASIITVTLLAIKFGWVSFVSTFASLIFLFGFFFTLIIYCINRPNITFTFQGVDKAYSSLLTELYNINLIINNKSKSELYYKEIVLHLEKGTLRTTDTGAEVVGAYANDKNMHWPHTQGIRIPLNDFKGSDGSLVHVFPLLVPNGYEQTEIKVTLYLHSNPYESGILAIFNPMLNYTIKETVKVDLTDLLN